MKINVAKSAGFCFGVKRAITIALHAAALDKKVDMLGDIVHNEHVMKDLQRSGIRKVKKLASGKNKKLLIQAHGSSLAVLKKARRLRYSLIDATCPMVKEIHRIALDMERKGYAIIIIGDRRHDEVRGIAGQLKRKALILEKPEDVRPASFKDITRVCVVVQSTQNPDKARAIVEAVRPFVKKTAFFNTICGPTRKKQREVASMPLKNDLMIIVGSKKSANTRRLYELSKSLNPRSYWINASHDIRREWFKDARNVGITAGASTPEETIREVVDYIAGVCAPPHKIKARARKFSFR